MINEAGTSVGLKLEEINMAVFKKVNIHVVLVHKGKTIESDYTGIDYLVWGQVLNQYPGALFLEFRKSYINGGF